MSRLNEKLEEIERYLDELGEIVPATEEEYRSSLVRKAACERYVEKIMEAVERPEHVQLGLIHLDELSRNMGKFKKALAERGIEIATYDSVQCLYEDLLYIIAEFGKYFSALKSGQEPRLFKKDAELFWFSLDKKYEELTELAQEIDEEYSASSNA